MINSFGPQFAGINSLGPKFAVINSLGPKFAMINSLVPKTTVISRNELVKKNITKPVVNMILSFSSCGEMICPLFLLLSN